MSPIVANPSQRYKSRGARRDIKVLGPGRPVRCPECRGHLTFESANGKAYEECLECRAWRWLVADHQWLTCL